MLPSRRVKPAAPTRFVMPQRQDEHHAPAEGLAHALQAPLHGKVVGPTEDTPLRATEAVGDRTACCRAEERRVPVVDHPAALQVDAADLREVSTVGAVRRQPLRHHCHRLGRVDGKVRARAEEGASGHAGRVEAAARLVADPRVAFALACVSTLRACAHERALDAARVHRESLVDAVCLPHVHLRAAVPLALHVGLAVHELDVARALRIAVARAELGAGCVAAAPPAISLHLDKVHRSVEAAGKPRHVDVEGKLAVLQLENPVGVIAAHHVEP
mmetsp:Transcript_88922/g.287981  ORF Transcript_88922/g.287981 Transcript_88922/m.287981 type:complete len:273 (-) Transcript_88922:453-1271(-)